MNGGVETVAFTCVLRWHALGSLTSIMGAERGHGGHRVSAVIVG